MGSKKIDSEFRFLLDIDTAFEEWRALAAEWLAGQKKDKLVRKTSLARFFVRYLRGQRLEMSPRALLEGNFATPPLWEALNLGSLSQIFAETTHDHISDFIEWVMNEKLSKADIQAVTPRLRNPFPRMRSKQVGKSSDVEFRYILECDSRMEDWRRLASEWLDSQLLDNSHKRMALGKFLSDYLLGHNLERNPFSFLRRDYAKPSFIDSVIRVKRQKTSMNSGGKWELRERVVVNNHVHDFLAWVLEEKLSVEDDNGYRMVPHDYQNPVSKMSGRGVGQSETLRTPLAYRYIRELRTMLVQGPNFRDWNWAQRALTGGAADWLIVAQSIIKRNDPDCVWRERITSKYEQKKLGYPPEVFELWSPARAVALYLKLELPLRTFQVRMLGSGESDTWRYESGRWRLNDSPLTAGSERRPSQRGVFHRSANEAGAGFYINTNKTADINKDEQNKGYVIPWTHEPVLYWLEKLRDWQEAYNPITAPTPWRELSNKHFGHKPHHAILEERGAFCFLFRHAAGFGSDRAKPLHSNSLHRIWRLLLVELEKRCEARGETLDDSSPIRFVDTDSSVVTLYPLHALRVSLITAYALDGGVPFPVLSKLIAGHARLIMTLYYTKAGKAHVTEIMQEAEKRILESEAASYRRFLMEKTYQEIEERFAFNTPDALRAVSRRKSVAGFLFEDKGICPVGAGLCDMGGEEIGRRGTNGAMHAPVPGYPHERNCVRCRFFLTGPAFLPGLQAHANWISYKATECSERFVRLEQQVKALEDVRLVCEERGEIFMRHEEFERLNHFYEAEAENGNKLLIDLQAVARLVDRCIAIAKLSEKDGVRLVAAGGISDIRYALRETESEMRQLEVICENAVIYPEVDAGKAVLRRSQILDAMLQLNGRPPIFFRLNQEQQLHVGNEVMKLIQARAGSLKDAVDFAEGKRLLADLGLLDETVGIIDEKTRAVGFHEVINATRPARLLIDKKSEREVYHEY